jgi:hypothetical protein
LAFDLSVSAPLDTPAGQQALKDMDEFWQTVAKILATASPAQTARIISQEVRLGSALFLFTELNYHNVPLANAILALEKALLTQPAAPPGGGPRQGTDYRVFLSTPQGGGPLNGQIVAQQWYIQNNASSSLSITITFSWVVTPPQGQPITETDTESYIVPAHKTLPAAEIFNPSFPNFQVVSASLG